MTQKSQFSFFVSSDLSSNQKDPAVEERLLFNFFQHSAGQDLLSAFAATSTSFLRAADSSPPRLKCS